MSLGYPNRMTDVRPHDLLTSRLGYLFKHAYLRLGAELVAALAPYRLLPRELGVLAVIEASPEELSQLEIAARLGVDRTTMVGVVDDLEGKGYVTRRRSDRDRRRNVVAITPAGTETLAEAERARERVEHDFLAPLAPPAAEALTSALLALYRSHTAEEGASGADTEGPDAHAAPETCCGTGMPDRADSARATPACQCSP